MTRHIRMKNTSAPPRSLRALIRRGDADPKTFCGANVTAYDVEPRDVSACRRAGWTLCRSCLVAYLGRAVELYVTESAPTKGGAF